MRLDAYTLPVDSKRLKKNQGRCARSLCFCDTLIALKTAKLSADLSTTCKRLSTTIWFACGCNTLLDVYYDNRWCNKWQFMIKDVGL